MTNVIIGKIRFAKGKEFTQQYECAAWHKRMVLESDTEVELRGKMQVTKHGELELVYGKINDTNVFYTVEGTVNSSDFTSHFGGNPIGSKVNEEIGEHMQYTGSMYAHALAHGIINGTNKNITLNERFRARKTYHVWDGEIKNSYGIFDKELDICGTIMKRFPEITFQWAKKLENDSIIAVTLDDEKTAYNIVAVGEQEIIKLFSFEFDKTGFENSNKMRDTYMSLK